MLSILLLSQKGEGNEIADKLVTEGCIVKKWVANRKRPVESTSLYPWQEVDRYQDYIETTDLFVFTSSGIGGLAEDLRKRGKMVVGGAVQDLLVRDSGVQRAALTLMGLEAKTSDKSIPLTLCGWYDGQSWWSGVAHRYPRLMEGDRGPVLDLGSLVNIEDSRLKEIEPVLEAAGYRGYVGTRVRMTEDALLFEDFHTDLTSSEIPAMCEALQLPLHSVLYNTAAQRINSVSFARYGLALRLMDFSSQAVFQPPKPAAKHCWRTYEDYNLGYISAAGDTPNEARRRAYRTVVNSVNIETVYRKDVGLNSLFEEAPCP